MNESQKENLKKVGSIIWTIIKYFLLGVLWLFWIGIVLSLALLVGSFCQAFGIKIPDIKPPNPPWPKPKRKPKPPETPDEIKHEKVENFVKEYPIYSDTPHEETILQKLMNAPKGKLISEILTEEEIEILFVMILRGFGISV